MAVNATGTIAGYYTDTSSVWHGFVRSPSGVYTEFCSGYGGYGHSQGTWSTSINAPGAIAGYYTDSASVTHGFERAPGGTMTQFDAPGALNTWANNINNAGAIVGYYQDASNVYHGFLTTLAVPMSAFSIGSLIVSKPGFSELGSFTLGAGGASFNPATDPVTFTFGTASIVIPAGSLNKLGGSNSFWFAGTVNGVSMFVDMQAQNPAATSYSFSIVAVGLDLTGQKEPMSVGLQVGQNTGSTTYKAFVF